MNPKNIHADDMAQVPDSRAVAAHRRALSEQICIVAAKAERSPVADPAKRHNPHFERIGGAPAIQQLVDAFYRNMEQMPDAKAIRAIHPSDLSRSKETLFKYLVGWMGGPPLYTAERGPPRLGQKHASIAIGDAERDAWMQCMRHALDCVVADEALRRELAQAFHKTATFLRNH